MINGKIPQYWPNTFPIIFIVVLYSGYLVYTIMMTSKYTKWNGMVLYGIKGIGNYGKEGLWVQRNGIGGYYLVMNGMPHHSWVMFCMPFVWKGMAPGSLGHLGGLV